MLLTLAALLISTVVAVHSPASPTGSPGAVKGTVTLTDARGEKFDAPGVQLALACRGTGDEERTATSDVHGVFRFVDVLPGRCLLTADLQGFGNVTTTLVVRPAETLDVAVHLDVEAVGSGPRVIAGSTSSWHTRRSN
jgi:hypothetical protein